MAKQRICTEMGTIRAGDVFLVDRWNGTRGEGWRIKCGSFQGLFLEDNEVELVPEILQQKLQLEQIKQDREVLLRQVEELSRERKELLETIERAADEQKVVIPKEVAEAIEQARMSGHEWELFYSEHINQKADRSIRHFQVIADYMKKITNVKTYFSALINGYTTKEAALEEQVNRMLHEWLETEYEGDEETDRREFAKRLVSFMRRELETKSR